MKTRERYTVDQLKQALKICFHVYQYFSVLSEYTSMLLPYYCLQEINLILNKRRIRIEKNIKRQGVLSTKYGNILGEKD